MSAKKESAQLADTSAGAAVELNDETVREFLKDNGDFLQRHPDMFDHLHISHASGSAVSLVEKQVSVLRERNIDMRHRLTTLTGNARDNDKLYNQTRALVLKLLEADSVEALSKAFINAMHKDFGVEHATIILFGDSAGGDNCRVESAEQAKNAIGSLMRGSKAVCCALRKEEMNYLFPTGKISEADIQGGRSKAAQAGSAGIMPLSDGQQLGLIAVGSPDPSYYSSSMGTLFLEHIADVIVRLLPRLQAYAPATITGTGTGEN